MASFAAVLLDGLLIFAAFYRAGRVGLLLLQNAYGLGQLAVQHASRVERQCEVPGRQFRFSRLPDPRAQYDLLCVGR
jgi:hypothetical protein